MVDEATFVSLNYDDIFDQRLFVYDSLGSLEDYLGPGRNWALIKLHGSINWARQVLSSLRELPDDPYLARTFASLGDEFELDQEIVLRPHPDLRGMRTEGGMFFYPALSAPLGQEDELVCPPQHVDFLKNVTGHWDPLDVLVIGYSGLDQEVIELLSCGGRPIRSLTVVSESAPSAVSTATRITEGVRIVPPFGGDSLPALWGDGFANFTRGDELGRYIAKIRETAKSEDLRREQLNAGQMPTT